MTNAKHTPGPWRLFGDGLKVKPARADLYFAPIAEAFPVIEWNDTDGNWNEAKRVEAHANARLIAAAPDLLGAVRAQLAATNAVEQAAADVMSELAIAKAEGQS